MGKARYLSLLAATLPLLLCPGACAKRGPAPDQAEKPFVFEGRPPSAVTFLSTQLNPVEEAGKMRNAILKDFPGEVDFRPNDNSYMFRQVGALLAADPAEPILLGATHGDLVSLYEKGGLRPASDIVAGLGERGFPEPLLRLCRLNGATEYYVPWMQASFVMVASRKALSYLPKGVDLHSLGYDQLLDWAKAIYEKTGKRALGFPAGKTGLMHRFFQGYLYPSFTGSTLLKFRGPAAEPMWEYFKELWRYAHPGSLVYSAMSDPLLAGDVWIAWDHTARLMKAFEQRPEDFAAFPAPAGPAGRGFMLIVSGLALPAGGREVASQAMLVDYLTRAPIQARTLREVGFFPVVALGPGDRVPAHLASLSAALREQAESSFSLPALAPTGLGEHGAAFNERYMLTFSGIVLEGRPAREVLDEGAAELQRIVDAADARCWLPDVSERRPCLLE
ncbi:MAG TPA: extracellular solute-binding protein [Spirochaetales bacterium]|nr:extracellular solute-binding protein [Spirochaetales bacterium]HRY53526.1 extracellular solute-binding protein [Spirochaetia bacterium]